MSKKRSKKRRYKLPSLYQNLPPAITPESLEVWQRAKQNRRPTERVQLKSLPKRLQTILRKFRNDYYSYTNPRASFLQCSNRSKDLANRLKEAGYPYAREVGLNLRNYPQFYGDPYWDPLDHAVVRLDTNKKHSWVYLIDFTATQFRPSAALPLIWKEPRNAYFTISGTQPYDRSQFPRQDKIYDDEDAEVEDWREGDDDDDYDGDL